MTYLPALGKNLIILDGAMGTLLLSEGFSGCLEELNLTAAEEIKRIHRAYSSADILLTNTFGLNSLNYKGSFSIKEIAEKAVDNARAARKTVYFDVGPLKNGGGLTFKERFEIYKEVAEAAKDAADGFFLETFCNAEEAEPCIAAFKDTSDKPVFACVAFTETTAAGGNPEKVAQKLKRAGADAVGVNCTEAQTALKAVKKMINAVSLPVIAKPNLGFPRFTGGGAVYGMKPDEFEEYAKKFMEAGVSAMGGCCGTTPEYINRIAKYSGCPVKAF